MLWLIALSLSYRFLIELGLEMKKKTKIGNKRKKKTNAMLKHYHIGRMFASYFIGSIKPKHYERY